MGKAKAAPAKQLIPEAERNRPTRARVLAQDYAIVQLAFLVPNYSPQDGVIDHTFFAFNGPDAQEDSGDAFTWLSEWATEEVTVHPNEGALALAVVRKTDAGRLDVLNTHFAGFSSAKIVESWTKRITKDPEGILTIAPPAKKAAPVKAKPKKKGEAVVRKRGAVLVADEAAESLPSAPLAKRRKKIAVPVNELPPPPVARDKAKALKERLADIKAAV